MEITNNDVLLSNGTSVRQLLKELKVPFPMELQVRNGKARLGLPDEYYQSSASREETALRIIDGLSSFVETARALFEACPEDTGRLTPRTYRMVDGAQKASLTLWFNPDAESRAGKTGGEDALANAVEELLRVDPRADLTSLSDNPSVALGQVRALTRLTKAARADRYTTDSYHDDTEDVSVIENL